MKKKISVLLVLALFGNVFLINGYAVNNELRNQAEMFITEAYADERYSMTNTEMNAILSQFKTEVDYVEGKYGCSIRELNEQTVCLLKREAILNFNNSNYRFSDLMDEISVAYARNWFWNEKSVDMLSTSEEPEVKIEVYRPFGPLRGSYFAKAATGTEKTYEGTKSVTIASGTEIYGITIEANLSKSVGYSIQGPADGTKLNNGKLATHRMAFGVLFGTMIKHTVTYPHGSEHIFYYIKQETMDAVDYSTLISIGSTITYADSMNGKTYSFADQNKLYADIEENPDRLIPA